MYSYKLYYGSELLMDSSRFNDYYETENEAREEAESERDHRIALWQIGDAWHEWDSIEYFDIVIEKK